MTTLETLQPICSKDDDRPKIATPFAMQWAGAKWAAATNGHMLAAVPFDGEVRADGPDAAAIIPATPPTHRATVASLREFAGKIHMGECDECHGDRSWECNCPDCGSEHDCERCGGTGESRTMRYGKLLDGILNRDYMLAVLGTVPEGVESVTLTHTGARDPFVFKADGWLAMIMPVMESYGEVVPFTAAEAL